MAGIINTKNRNLGIASVLWVAAILYVAYREYMKVVHDPTGAALANDATGVVVNIVLIGLALQFAFMWMVQFVGKRTKRM